MGRGKEMQKKIETSERGLERVEAFGSVTGWTDGIGILTTDKIGLFDPAVCVLNKEFSVISTGPVDRERRKGWDVARGKSPPPISDKTVDEELQPKEEEEEAPAGAPAPVPT